MSLPESVILILRECSHDEAAFQRLLALVVPSFDKDLAYDRILEAHHFAERITAMIPDIVYVYDLHQARNVYVNQEVARWLGYSGDEIQAMGNALFATIMHPDDLARLPERNRRFDTMSEGEFIETEYRMRHKDGEWRWLSSRDGVFKRNAEGKVTQILGIAQDTTERKRIAAELLEKYAELEHFFALSLDLWCIASIDGYFLKLNPAWKTALGYPLEELEGKRFLEFVHPDDLQSTLDTLSTLNAQTPVQSFTNRYRHQNGSYRFIEWRSLPNGKLIYATARDVTALKQAHDALAESESRYRSVVTTMSEGIVVQDSGGYIRTCNTAAESILGLTVEQMTGRTSIDPLWRAVHEDLSPFPGETHPTMVALQTGKPVLNVIMGVHKPDSTLTWILVNAQPLFQPNDVQPYAVVASFTDITPVRHMEAALQQSEARLRSIFETIDDGVWSMEMPGNHITYMNPAGERILGRSLTTFQQDADLRLKIVHPDDLPELLEAFENIPESGRVDIEYRVMHPDDTIRWVHSRAWHIYDAEQNLLRVEGILSDITERKMLEQRQIELQIERERIKLLGGFITNTSHELRTPLTVIGVQLHLMGRIDDQEARKKHAALAQDQIKHLSAMITQLHDMAKLDQLSRLEMETIAVEHWIRAAVSQYVIRKRDVHVQTAFAAALPEIQGDPDYLSMALQQLIDNAVQFSPEGGHIFVRALRSGSEVIVDVEDHGTGIPAEHLARIFDHFYKADAARTQSDGGAGMGLTIVRRVMQLHGGSVSVESEVGTGTTFRLHLPAVMTSG
jgi:PAS domain S-box-containing protein